MYLNQYCCISVEAERRETMSLRYLQQLVTRSCEALALWNILADHQFHVVAAALTKVGGTGQLFIVENI